MNRHLDRLAEEDPCDVVIPVNEFAIRFCMTNEELREELRSGRLRAHSFDVGPGLPRRIGIKWGEIVRWIAQAPDSDPTGVIRRVVQTIEKDRPDA